MTWRSSSRSKISPLHVTYVSIPSMSICFSCFTNCSTCSWLYGPKPPAPLPVQAAGPAEADPATPAGPVPPLLPVQAAGPTEVDPAAAGLVPVLPVEAARNLLGAGAVGLVWGGRLGLGPGLGAGGGQEGGAGAGARGRAGGWDGDWGGKNFSIPSMSMCFSCFTNCSTCSWLYGPKPPAQLPVQAAMPGEADPATPAGSEVDPAAAGPVPVLPSKQLGSYWGLRAGGWAEAEGRELGAGAGRWGRGLGAGGREPRAGYGGGAGGWGLGGGGGEGGAGAGAQGLGAGNGHWTAKIGCTSLRVYTHVHVLQLLGAGAGGWDP